MKKSLSVVLYSRYPKIWFWVSDASLVRRYVINHHERKKEKWCTVLKFEKKFNLLKLKTKTKINIFQNIFRMELPQQYRGLQSEWRKNFMKHFMILQHYFSIFSPLWRGCSALTKNYMSPCFILWSRYRKKIKWIWTELI